MRKLIALAGFAALAACNQAEAPEADEPVAVETPMAVNSDVGTWDITDAEGRTARTQINADGTYRDIVDGEEAGTGTWRRSGQELCFDGDAEGMEEACWTTSAPSADGSFTATDPNGASSTVRPVEADSMT